MKISVTLEEGESYCAIDFTQSDIDNMWNYLMSDSENFEYQILDYLNVNFETEHDNWKDNPQFEELYNNLKQLFENDRI